MNFCFEKSTALFDTLLVFINAGYKGWIEYSVFLLFAVKSLKIIKTGERHKAEIDAILSIYTH